MSVLCGHNRESTVETLERATSKSARRLQKVESENPDSRTHILSMVSPKA